MRIGILALATMLVLGPGAATAGVLELLVDDTSQERYCDLEPCRHNALEARTRYLKDHYRRYRIETEQAEYDFREVEIRTMPPKVVLQDRPGKYVWVDGKRLLVATPGRTVELEGSAYETETVRVLVRPARNRVIREKPTWAYYPDRAVVVGEGCGKTIFALRC
jgi:hypothetical protein